VCQPYLGVEMNAAAATESLVRPAGDDERPVRRVREEVKDGLAVIAVSALTSTALAAVLVVLTRVAS